MISIVVCSTDLKAFNLFEQNVAETIGVRFEVIKIDNSANAFGICEAYNHGARKANYDLICYAHEDIRIITQDWGKMVVETFQENHNLGLLGIAGSTYKSYSPSGWWGFDGGLMRVNLIQHFKYSNYETVQDYSNPENGRLSKVACIDGVWMCTRRNIAVEIGFDSSTFKGFHCYDLDFSFSVLRQYEVAVGFDVLLEHFSEGRYDKSWVGETIKLHSKWKDKLPINVTGGAEVQHQEESRLLEKFISLMRHFGFPASEILKIANSRDYNKHAGYRQIIMLNARIVWGVVKRLFKLHEHT